jgi:hypothetical protein
LQVSQVFQLLKQDVHFAGLLDVQNIISADTGISCHSF